MAGLAQRVMSAGGAFLGGGWVEAGWAGGLGVSTVFPWGVFEVGVLAEKGSLKMGNGVFRLPNNRINILLIQQPFFNFFTHQFGSLLKKGIIIIIPDTKFF